MNALRLAALLLLALAACERPEPARPIVDMIQYGEGGGCATTPDGGVLCSAPLRWYVSSDSPPPRGAPGDPDAFADAMEAAARAAGLQRSRALNIYTARPGVESPCVTASGEPFGANCTVNADGTVSMQLPPLGVPEAEIEEAIA